MGPIRRLLVANRAEIAGRVFRSAHAMGVETVAVYSEPDAGLPFVRQAGTAVALAGSTSAETYLNIDRLLAAARHCNADAVHPGYGFLSESAGFARAVIDAGLTWVGPNPSAIEAMGDKLRAKALVQEAGVPVLRSAAVPASLSPDGLAAAARSIGYPVLVKASAGGGGRGMRIVRDPGQLSNAVASARREAKSAFSDDTVFLERYVERARHIEVQVFGDQHGNIRHLFERECSIQRRHQKVIEEAPSPVMTPELRERMTSAAVRAAQTVKYDNAGTVEFLLDEVTGEFSFLEMNTRLQVEHPVTEAITGLDLVREQLLVAAGAPLSFLDRELTVTGNAIEVRLYAEDPARNFLPSPGRIAAWVPATDPAVRWDDGFETGCTVPVFYDAMLAKVIAHAPSRAEAAGRLALALQRSQLAGITTNRDFLVNVLRDEQFLKGDTTTDYIERVAPPRSRVPDRPSLIAAAIAAVLPPGREPGVPHDPWLRATPRAATPTRSWLRVAGGERLAVDLRQSPDGCTAWTGGPQAATVRWRGDMLEVAGIARSYRLVREGARAWVHDGVHEIAFELLPPFEPKEAGAQRGEYTAPMPGRVVSVHVTVGERVALGQLLLVLEAMKMEHQLVAHAVGVVAEVLAAAGQQVEGGQQLVRIEG
jgi:propionyl-CoA carboxylase alpha chain